MTTDLRALELAQHWRSFWADDTGIWILGRGVPIALLLIGGLLAARFINWTAQRVTRRIDAQYQESDQLVRTESAKHRQAVASVISWVSVALLFVMVGVSPPGTTIGAIVRDDEVLIAHDSTVIESDDHVILFVIDKKHVRDVERLFQVGLTFL